MQGIAINAHMRPVTQVLFNNDGDLLFSVAKEPVVNVWYTKTGERLGSFDGHKAVAGCDVNFSSTLLATAGLDLKTILWDVQTGKQLTVVEQLSPCRAVGFSHDDRMLFAVCDKKMSQPATIHFYHLPDSLGTKPVRTEFNPFVTYKDNDESITCCIWGPTNQHVYFGTEKGTMVLLDVETQKEICTQFPHGDVINKLHFDANYYTLVSASKDHTAKLFDFRDIKSFQSYKSDLPVNDASISPLADHVILAGGTEAQDVTTTGGQSKFEVKFYHKVQETLLGQVKCHFGTINSVQFHPSGRGFASGAVDGFVKVYDFPRSYYQAVGHQPLFKHKSLILSNEDEDMDEAEEDEVEE